MNQKTLKYLSAYDKNMHGLHMTSLTTIFDVKQWESGTRLRTVQHDTRPMIAI